MARWSVVLCLLLGAVSQAAGDVFVETYGGSGADTAACVAIAPDGGLVVVGYDGPDGCILVTRFDPQGEVTWTSQHRFRAEAHGAVATADYVYVVGRIRASVTADWDFLVWKLNSHDGTTVWRKRWDNDASDDVLRDVMIARDGGLWAAGSMQGIGQDECKKVVIAHLNPGETTLECAYAGTGGILHWDAAGSALTEVFDADDDPWGFAVVGTLWSGTAPWNWEHDIIVTQFTRAPVHHDTHVISNDTGGDWDEYGTDIVRTTDRELAVTGYATDEYGNGSAMLVKLGSGMSFEWAKITSGGSAYWKRLDSVIETTDREGGIVAAGSSGAGGSTPMLVTKWSLSGALTWNRVIGPDAGVVLPRSVVELDDWSLVAAGMTSAWGAGGDDVLLSRHTVQGHTCLRDEAQGPSYAAWTPNVTGWIPPSTGTFPAPLTALTTVLPCQGYDRAVTRVCSSRTIRVCPSPRPADFEVVQDGIDDAWHGDVVELCDTTFVGPGNRDLDFGGKEITVRSASGSPLTCVIDCQASGRGAHFGLSDPWSAVLEGIAFRNGSADYGGGVSCEGASPTIRNCVFDACAADDGGGVFCEDAAPIIGDCVFESCTAINGGGLYLSDADPAISGCVFYDCLATYGGAVNVWQSGPSLGHCTFLGNSADFGSALWVSYGEILEVPNCVVAFDENGPGEPVYCWPPLQTPAPQFSCTDIYGNKEGDWVGPIDGQLGQRGNISTDPLLYSRVPVVAPSGLPWFSPREDSPCAAQNSAAGCGFIGATPLTCPVDHEVTPGLAAYWSFFEGAGLIAHDSSSFGNHGDVVDASWSCGRHGGGLEIEGDEIVTDIPAWFDDGVSDALTVSAWVKWYGPSPYDTPSYIFDGRQRNWVADGGALLAVTVDGLPYFTLYGPGGVAQSVTAQTAIPQDAWVHIAGVFDGVAHRLRLFIDAEQTASVAAPYAYTPTSTPVAIGNDGSYVIWPPPVPAPLNGVVDELRVYAQALDRFEIREDSGLAQMAAYWPFDEDRGSTVYDVSGHRNDGSLSGTAAWVEGIQCLGLELVGNGAARGIPESWDDSIADTFAIDAWVNWYGPSAYGTSSYVFDGRKRGVVSDGGALLAISPDSLPYFSLYRSGGSVQSVMAQNPVAQNEWVHIVGEFDGVADELRLLIDGEEDASAVAPHDYTDANTSVAIGNNVWESPLAPLNGVVDELKVVVPDGTTWVSGPSEAQRLSLDVHPNPFNPVADIEYELPASCDVRLEVYNLAGRRQAVLVSAHQTAGRQTARWDASGEPSGVYFLRLCCDGVTATRKAILLK